MSANNERWLSDGNCALCRRQSYCTKTCTAQKKRRNAIMRAMLTDRTGIDRVRRLIEERQARHENL